MQVCSRQFDNSTHQKCSKSQRSGSVLPFLPHAESELENTGIDSALVLHRAENINSTPSTTATGFSLTESPLPHPFLPEECSTGATGWVTAARLTLSVLGLYHTSCCTCHPMEW